jgi:Sec-independent protein translocase protein TatA
LHVLAPQQPPALGKSLGKGMREFKRATEDLKSNWDEHLREAERAIDLKDEQPKEGLRPEVLAEASQDTPADAPDSTVARADQTEPFEPEPIQNKPIE